MDVGGEGGVSDETDYVIVANEIPKTWCNADELLLMRTATFMRRRVIKKTKAEALKVQSGIFRTELQ